MIRFAQTTAASGGFFSNRNNLWILIGFGILLFLVLVLVIAALISHQKKKKAIGTPAEELWHDRKRVLGLPLTMTRYWIDHDRFYVKTGFFNREVAEDAALYWNKDEGMLAELINKVDSMDEMNRTEFGDKAKKRIVNSFSWSFIGDEYLKVWLR